MGLVLYLFGAIILVLVVGWAVYVLPTPGPLGPGELALGLVPVLTILLGVAALIFAVWVLMKLGSIAARLLRRL